MLDKIKIIWYTVIIREQNNQIILTKKILRNHCSKEQ